MNDKEEQIRNVESEILNCKNKLGRMKKRIPLAILGGIGFALLFPFMPGLRGRRPMIENWEYDNAVIFSAVIFAIVYPIAYTMGKNQTEKKMRELKLKKHLIEKKN